MKDIYWFPKTEGTLSKFPDEVRNDIGFALYCEQMKKSHPGIKPLKGFRETVREVKCSFKSDAYRAVYTVDIADSLYVLHVFQ